MDVVSTLTGFAGALRAVGRERRPGAADDRTRALGRTRPGQRGRRLLGHPAVAVLRAGRPAQVRRVFDLWFRGARPHLPGPSKPAQQVRMQQLQRRRRPGQRAPSRATRTRCCAPRRASRGAAPPRRGDVVRRAARRDQPADRAAARHASAAAGRCGGALAAVTRVDVRRTVRADAARRRRAGRVALHQTARQAAPARAARRRERVDGAVRGRLAALRPRRRPHRTGRPPRSSRSARGSRGSPGSCGCATRSRRCTAAGTAIPDWCGGTRIGDVLRAFLDLWGQRGTARRAVVVLFSDGWERGDAALLGEQMARSRGWRTGWCGSIRTRARTASRRLPQVWSPRCPTSTS